MVNFEYISHLALVFLLLTLDMKLSAGRWCQRNIAKEGNKPSSGKNNTDKELMKFRGNN